MQWICCCLAKLQIGNSNFLLTFSDHLAYSLKSKIQNEIKILWNRKVNILQEIIFDVWISTSPASLFISEICSFNYSSNPTFKINYQGVHIMQKQILLQKSNTHQWRYVVALTDRISNKMNEGGKPFDKFLIWMSCIIFKLFLSLFHLVFHTIKMFSH